MNSIRHAHVTFLILSFIPVSSISGQVRSLGARESGERIEGINRGQTIFRISTTDLDNPIGRNASSPDIAYNHANDEFLVVWAGDVEQDGEVEIHGRRLQASTGEPVDQIFRISGMGPNGDSRYTARRPAIAYNSVNNEYLVVWQGDDDTTPLVDDEHEIFGQRLSADPAQFGVIGSNFRISTMGPDGNADFDAFTPGVVYIKTNNEYLVVWAGDNTHDNKIEVFGRRFDANAHRLESASDQFRISHMGASTGTRFRGQRPAVAYNTTDNQYLVVWEGIDENTTGSQYEIFGRRFETEQSGIQEMESVFRISSSESPEIPLGGARRPELAYNDRHNEYLVVWQADKHRESPIHAQYEIFGQRIDAASGAIHDEALHFSPNDPSGNLPMMAVNPKIDYHSELDAYLVIWRCTDDASPLVEKEYQLVAQLLPGGDESKVIDEAVFHVNELETTSSADQPVVARGAEGFFQIVWRGAYNSMTRAGTDYSISGRNISFEVPGRNIEAEVIPLEFRLDQNYPNPFTNTTTLQYHLPDGVHVTLQVFDVLGREVARLVDQQQEAGIHRITFESPNLASGLYLFSLTAGSYKEVRKMILSE